ncbi:MAG: amino acid adenylation domain-containing protein, partial [Cyanobacteria bacterium P01_H01_bin.121]
DRYGNPVPIGVVGELYLSGVGLAEGYLNRPTLTAEKFMTETFTGQAQRCYRTGDRVRYRPDGQLEFLGLFDHQIKIRGYRIELGEIEAILSQHPTVLETVVVAYSTGAGLNQQLVAYVVTNQAEPTETGLWRSYLSDRLPGYLIPNRFVELETLPRLPNGKIDRRSLPSLAALDGGPVDSASHVEPQTDLEKALARIWCQALNREQVSIEANFFELGGHSLLAMQIAAESEIILGQPVPLRYLFQTPTIASLAAQLETDKTQTNSATPTTSNRVALLPDPDSRYEPFPLTDIQQAYVLGRNQAFELGNVATHGYREIEITGLPLVQVEQALQALIDRHDMLRVIVPSAGQQQVLATVPPYQIAVNDLRGQPESTIQSTLLELRDRLSHQIFALDQWPLFGVEAVQLTDTRIRFFLSFDVLIGDAWSFQLLGREMAQLLQGHGQGHNQPDLSLRFRDYRLADLAFEQTATYAEALDYWRDRLATLPPAPELPLTMAPSAMQQPQFVRRSGKLAAADWSALKQAAGLHGLTPSGVVLAAFAEILARWSQQPQFTLNLTLFNRLPLHPEVNRLVGDFTSSLLLGIDLESRDGFADRAQRLQTQLAEDLDRRVVSGVKVLRELAQTQKRTTGALMPVVFTSTLGQNITSTHALEAGDRPWDAEMVYSVSQTSQVYLDHQVSEIDGELIFNWDAIDALFPAGLLDDMFQAYSELLQKLAQDSSSWQSNVQGCLTSRPLPLNPPLPIMSAGKTEPLLQTLFFEQVERNPEATALIAGQQVLSYRELAQHVLYLTQQLKQLDIQSNQLVAVSMEKGWEQVVAVLGILTAGAAYVPIDPALPQERRWHLIQETGARLLLTQTSLSHQLTWPPLLNQLCLSESVPESISLSEIPKPQQQPSDLAYVIYTSGSTGLPKGVMIDHRSVINTLLDLNERFQVQPSDRILALSSLSFDLSVYDIFGTLAAGATLIIPEGTRDPAHWLQLMHEHRITVWNSVPALMQLLLTEAQTQPNGITNSDLRLVLLSGDWIPLSLPDSIKAYAPQTQLISLGGATEASIWSIYYPVEAIAPDWTSIPYGYPLDNQAWYVLNQQLDPCPVWVPGELYIGGQGLAQGYWQQPELTAERFFEDHQGNRLYKTGDLGRYRPDGSIEFLGRADFQVKINGYRIETGEIESVLTEHPAIATAVVTAVGTAAERQQLAAYIVPVTLNRLDFKQQRLGVRSLPEDQTRIALPLPEVDNPPNYLRRQSYRQFLSTPIALAAFSQWLACLRSQQLPGMP